MNNKQQNTWHQLRSIVEGLDRMYSATRCRRKA